MERPQGVRTRIGRRVAALGSLAGALLLLAATVAAPAQAVPGDLDLTFSGDGKQMTDFRPVSAERAIVRQPDGKIVAVGGKPTTVSDFALARYNPDGSLDTSFSGDGKQMTDFGGATGRTGWRSRRRQDRRGRPAAAASATSRSPATTPTARSTRASPATARRRPTSAGRRPGDGVALQADGKIVAVGAPTAGTRLRARPLQPERVARHELLRRRQGDDRLVGRRRANGVAIQARRQDRRGRLRASTADGDFALARYNPNGIARHDLLRRRQADDRLRGHRRRERGGDPGATARSSRSAGRSRPRRRRLRARPLQPERLARHELLRRRQADDRLRGAVRRRRAGWRSRPTARSSSAAAQRRHTATSRSPATTRTARSTRASPATAS